VLRKRPHRSSQGAATAVEEDVGTAVERDAGTVIEKDVGTPAEEDGRSPVEGDGQIHGTSSLKVLSDLGTCI
jgi:hypothetical protein